MNLPAILPALSERIGWTLLHSLWIGMAIALALACALAFLRDRSAAARHAACVLAIIGMLGGAVLAFLRAEPARPAAASIVVPVANVVTQPGAPLEMGSGDFPAPVLSSALNPAVEPNAAETPVAAAAAPARLQDALRPWLPFIVAGWFVGFVLLSLRHFGGWWRIRSWRRTAEPVAMPLGCVVEKIVAQLKLRGEVVVRQSSAVVAPMLTGLFRPVILLPARLLTGLAEDELRAIIAHELAHLARRDAWSNLAQVIVETAFFYHPAMWWMSRRARAERELAADDLALRVCDDRRAYAETLVRLAEWQTIDAPAFALPAASGNLLFRIRRIVLPPPREPASAGWTLPAVLAASAILLTVGFRAVADDPKIITIKPGESLQAAIDGAPAGAIIRLGEGHWKERITIAKPLTLEGAGWEKTFIQPEQLEPGDTPEARAAFQKRFTAGLSESEHAALHAEWREKFEKPTISVRDAKVTVRRLTIKGVLHPDREVKQRLPPDALVYFQNAKGTLNGCVLAGYYRGIQVSPGSDVEVRGCLVAGMWSEGINVESSGRVHVVESEVRNCLYAGIVLGRECNTSIIEGSRISGAAWHGLRYDHAAPTLRGNVFFNNERTDIYASGKTRAIVRDNLLLSGGIWALMGNEDTIEGNTFVGERCGLGVSAGASPAVIRNIFVGQQAAITCTIVQDSDPLAGILGNPRLEQNLFWKVQTPFKVANKAQPLPPGNLQMEPQFTDPAAQDYTLIASSPARLANIGAADPLHPSGPWALRAEEKAMIPDGNTRDVNQWKAPGEKQPSKQRDELLAQAREVANSWVTDALQLDDVAKREAVIEKIHAAVEHSDTANIRAGLNALGRIGQVAFDKASFRPALRRLLQHPEPDVRAAACSVLAASGKSAEDVALVIPLTTDEAVEVKTAAAWALKWLTGGDFTGEAGRAIQRLLETANPKLQNELWGTMWGTKVSPEIEQIVVAASRRDDNGSGYSDVFYHALSVHLSKREPTITRLIELLASEDATNVAGRVLWGLQQGVEEDQRPRVAEAAAKVIVAREDGYMRREAFDCLRLYGTSKNAGVLRELLAKPGVTGTFRDELQKTLAAIEVRR